MSNDLSIMDYIREYIAFGALLVSIISIYIAVRTSKQYKLLAINLAKEHTQFQFFAEYTKRYQELMIRLYKGKSSSEEKEIFYQLYFDLCSEEFYLNEKGAIPKDVWQLWKEGIKTAMKNKSLQTAWKGRNGVYYSNKGFVHFMNDMQRASLS